MAQVDYKILGTIYKCWGSGFDFLNFNGPEIFKSLEELKAKYPKVKKGAIDKVSLLDEYEGRKNVIKTISNNGKSVSYEAENPSNEHMIVYWETNLRQYQGILSGLLGTRKEEPFWQGEHGCLNNHYEAFLTLNSECAEAVKKTNYYQTKIFYELLAEKDRISRNKAAGIDGNSEEKKHHREIPQNREPGTHKRFRDRGGLTL